MDMGTEEDTVDMEQLVRVYRKIRDVRKANKKEFTLKDNDLKEKQSLITANILEFFNTTKQQNAKTAFGTAYKKLKTQASCSDWVTFYAWIKEHDAFQFLHKRVTEKEVAKYREVHKTLPPGVRVNEAWVIGILGADGKDEDDDD
jgi:hypothetical protein